MRILVLLFAAFVLHSCGQEQASTEEAIIHSGPEYFGEKIETAGAVSLAQLHEKLAGKDSVNITLQATVESVCQAKGCWMNLVGGDSVNGEIFVKFKDYGFFMPMDIAGQEVVLDGIAYKELTSVDELRHYAEDAGASQEEMDAITEPKEELKFMAHGVKLLAEK
ncbi:MAG: DUF4920 domain-containing protein [Saprospiraceae bacterium]|nr:DUF4920 domain-containing protein [Saprospiraceae bacterium]